MDEMDEEALLKTLHLQPGASLEEIQQAYQETVKDFHPDLESSDSLARSIAEQRLKSVDAAFTQLSALYQVSETPGGERAEASPNSSSTRWAIVALSALAGFVAVFVVFRLFTHAGQDGMGQKPEVRPAVVSNAQKQAKFEGDLKAADELLANKKFAEALASFQECERVRPDSSEVTEGIKAAQTGIAAEKYAAAMSEGNELLSQKQKFRLGAQTNDDARSAEFGIVVVRVYDQSAAQKAGFLPGDRILAVNGTSILSGLDFTDAIRQAPEGTSVVRVWRNGSLQVLKPVLAPAVAATWDDVEAAFTRALDIKPSDPAAVEGLCKSWVLHGAQCKTPEEALEWYRKAADRGDGLAELYVGLCYMNGKGVSAEPKDAVRWFRKSADSGNSGAQNLLGYTYDHGLGQEADCAEAVKWFKKSAAQGNMNGQRNLGYMLYSGRGCTKDIEEARKWIQKAADQGDAEAMKFLQAWPATK